MTPDEKRENVAAYLMHLAHLVENSDPESITGQISLEVMSSDHSCASLVVKQPSRRRKADMNLTFTVDVEDVDGEEDLDDGEEDFESGCGGNAHLSGLTPGGSCRERPPMTDMAGLTNAHMNEMEDAKWLDFGLPGGNGRHIEIEPLQSLTMLTPMDLVKMWRAMGLTREDFGRMTVMDQDRGPHR